MKPRKNSAPGLRIDSTKFIEVPTDMRLTWLGNLRSGLTRILGGAAGEIDRDQEWIEPVETRTALGLSEDAIVIGHPLPLSNARMFRFLLDVLVEALRTDQRVHL